MSGQIIRMKNPIVIYKGDHFQPLTNQRGELIIDYKPNIPRTSTEIIGCWVCIELPGGSLDFKWLLQDDIERLKKYSTPKATQNNPNPKANALYSSEGNAIDPGFLEAKTIKHAMRSYTKLRVGENVAMDDEQDQDEPELTPTEPYGNPLPKNENTVQFEINPNESF
jgi:recombinational DNA repair protein RecT